MSTPQFKVKICIKISSNIQMYLMPRGSTMCPGPPGTLFVIPFGEWQVQLSHFLDKQEYTPEETLNHLLFLQIRKQLLLSMKANGPYKRAPNGWKHNKVYISWGRNDALDSAAPPLVLPPWRVDQNGRPVVVPGRGCEAQAGHPWSFAGL